MIIELKKFGQILTSRDDGREAYSVIQPTLKSMVAEESIEINFKGVNVLTPGWGDEFITPLFKKFGKNLILKYLKNPSVEATLDTIEKANKIRLNKNLN